MRLGKRLLSLGLVLLSVGALCAQEQSFYTGGTITTLTTLENIAAQGHHVTLGMAHAMLTDSCERHGPAVAALPQGGALSLATLTVPAVCTAATCGAVTLDGKQVMTLTPHHVEGQTTVDWAVPERR